MCAKITVRWIKEVKERVVTASCSPVQLIQEGQIVNRLVKFNV